MQNIRLTNLLCLLSFALLSHVAYADGCQPPAPPCLPIKTCTLEPSGACMEPGSIGQQAYKVWQQIDDCNGHQISWNSIADDQCSDQANALLMSAACN